MTILIYFSKGKSRPYYLKIVYTLLASDKSYSWHLDLKPGDLLLIGDPKKHSWSSKLADLGLCNVKTILHDSLCSVLILEPKKSLDHRPSALESSRMLSSLCSRKMSNIPLVTKKLRQSNSDGREDQQTDDNSDGDTDADRFPHSQGEFCAAFLAFCYCLGHLKDEFVQVSQNLCATRMDYADVAQGRRDTPRLEKPSTRRRNDSRSLLFLPTP